MLQAMENHITHPAALQEDSNCLTITLHLYIDELIR